MSYLRRLWHKCRCQRRRCHRRHCQRRLWARHKVLGQDIMSWLRCLWQRRLCHRRRCHRHNVLATTSCLRRLCHRPSESYSTSAPLYWSPPLKQLFHQQIPNKTRPGPGTWICPKLLQISITNRFCKICYHTSSHGERNPFGGGFHIICMQPYWSEQ